MVLASAYINSPASAFGHTFLRFDKDLSTPLLSYVLNYSAKIGKENPLSYAYKGILGGYRGYYSIEPYYKKLKEYLALEQRDIWEYTLNLSQEEIDKMVRHIFEIRHFYSDYFFISKNCSYNLLWLIEVAKDDVNLVDKFEHKAIPLDTIRAVVLENLVKKSSYRASKHKEILRLNEAIKDNPKALEFAKSNEYDLSKIDEFSKEEKIASLELAIALSKDKVDKKCYLPKLLKARSKLGKSIKKRDLIEPSSSPLEGHYSTKATIGYGNSRALKVRAKVAYHDIYDNDNGYLSGAYIDFLETALEYKEHKLHLEEFNLLDIKSYAIQDSIFNPISWQVSLGAKRIFNDELNSYLQVGGGVTLGREKLYFYTTLTPTLYYKNHEELSLSANVGVLYNPSKYLKFGLLSSNEWFSRSREILKVEPFVTYSINQELAFNLRYEYKKMQEEVEDEFVFSWFWYF